MSCSHKSCTFSNIISLYSSLGINEYAILTGEKLSINLDAPFSAAVKMDNVLTLSLASNNSFLLSKFDPFFLYGTNTIGVK